MKLVKAWFSLVELIKERRIRYEKNNEFFIIIISITSYIIK